MIVEETIKIYELIMFCKKEGMLTEIYKVEDTIYIYNLESFGSLSFSR